MSSCGSNAGMEMTAPVVNVIINNALFHSNSHISQVPPQIIHTLRSLIVISQSLLSPTVKVFWKSINICGNFKQLSTGIFYVKHGVIC